MIGSDKCVQLFSVAFQWVKGEGALILRNVQNKFVIFLKKNLNIFYEMRGPYQKIKHSLVGCLYKHTVGWEGGGGSLINPPRDTSGLVTPLNAWPKIGFFRFGVNFGFSDKRPLSVLFWEMRILCFGKVFIYRKAFMVSNRSLLVTEVTEFLHPTPSIW